MKNNTKYFIENNLNVIPVTVLKEQGCFSLIQLPDSEGAIRVRSTKLYDTEEEAKKLVPPKPLKWHYEDDYR